MERRGVDDRAERSGRVNDVPLLIQMESVAAPPELHHDDEQASGPAKLAGIQQYHRALADCGARRPAMVIRFCRLPMQPGMECTRANSHYHGRQQSFRPRIVAFILNCRKLGFRKNVSGELIPEHYQQPAFQQIVLETVIFSGWNGNSLPWWTDSSQTKKNNSALISQLISYSQFFIKYILFPRHDAAPIVGAGVLSQPCRWPHRRHSERLRHTKQKRHRQMPPRLLVLSGCHLLGGAVKGPVETTELADKKRRQHHAVGGNAKDWFMSLRRVHRGMSPLCAALCARDIIRPCVR